MRTDFSILHSHHRHNSVANAQLYTMACALAHDDDHTLTGPCLWRHRQDRQCHFRWARVNLCLLHCIHALWYPAVSTTLVTSGTFYSHHAYGATQNLDLSPLSTPAATRCILSRRPMLPMVTFTQTPLWLYFLQQHVPQFPLLAIISSHAHTGIPLLSVWKLVILLSYPFRTSRRDGVATNVLFLSKCKRVSKVVSDAILCF